MAAGEVKVAWMVKVKEFTTVTALLKAAGLNAEALEAPREGGILKCYQTAKSTLEQ